MGGREAKRYLGGMWSGERLLFLRGTISQIWPNVGIATTLWSQQLISFRRPEAIFNVAGNGDLLNAYIDSIRLAPNSSVPEPGTGMLKILCVAAAG